jgi:hypothetical protein
MRKTRVATPSPDAAIAEDAKRGGKKERKNKKREGINVASVRANARLIYNNI